MCHTLYNSITTSSGTLLFHIWLDHKILADPYLFMSPILKKNEGAYCFCFIHMLAYSLVKLVNLPYMFKIS